MSMISQGVMGPAEEQFEVGDFLRGGVDDYGVGGKIAQALVLGRKRATDAANRVESRQKINHSQKVSDHNLRGSQPESFGIDDPNFQDPFSQCSAAPVPLEKNGITDRNDKITDSSSCQSEVRINDRGQEQNLREQAGDNGDGRQVNGKGEETSHRTGQVLSKANPFRGANDLRIRPHSY